MSRRQRQVHRAAPAGLPSQPRAGRLRRGVITALASLLLLPIPMAIPTLAAGSVTGLYIDGALDDPLSQGLQRVYESPDAILSQAAPSPDHTVVALALDVDGWSLVFTASPGQTLTIGHRYGGVQVGRTGHPCEPWGADVTVSEIEWGADGELLAFAADFHHACYPHQGLYGSVRFHASGEIVAVATDTLDLDLGQTELGSPGPTVTVTVSNLGHTPVTLGPARVIPGNALAEIVSDACALAPLAVGATCRVGVRLTGARVGLNDFSFVEIPDDTAQRLRRVRVHGQVWTDTTTTVSFDPARSYWPSGTYVQATVTPAPTYGGTVTFTYLDDQGQPVDLKGSILQASDTAGLLVTLPRGDHEWTAHFDGVDGWRPSTSAPQTQHTGIDTITTLTATTNPISSGTAGELRATVATVGGGAVPAGTLTIKDGGGAVVGAGPVDGASGSVTAAVQGLAMGGHDFTATYASSGDGSPSTASYRLFVRTLGIEEAWAAGIPMASGALYLHSIATDGSAVYVAGTTSIGGVVAGETSTGEVDVVVARFDGDGTLAWATQLGTAYSERAGGVAVTPAGVFVAGTGYGRFESSGTWPEEHPFVARLSLDGDLAWVQQDPMPGDAWQAAPAPDGGAYVAGVSDDLVTWGLNAANIRRYRPDGTMAWESVVASCCLANQPEGVTGLASLSSDPGGVLISGYARGSVITGATDDDERGWVRRYSPTGTILWTREIDGPYGAVVAGQAAAGQAGILVSGSSQAPIAGQPNAFPAGNVWTRHYTFDGSTVWTKPFAWDRLVADCSSFVALGRTMAIPTASQGGTVVRVGLDGSDQWRYEAPGTPTAWTVFHDVAVAAGRVYLVRQLETPDGWTTQVLALKGIPARTDCDTRAPTTTAPRPAFGTGSTLGATIAVRQSWTASDGQSGIARHELTGQSDYDPWALVSDGLASGTVVQPLAPGHRYRFSARVVDRGGNSATATGSPFRVNLVEDRSGSVTYRGTWRSASSAGASGGTLRYATAAGATASFRFTGRSVAWVSPRGATRGQARVYVDGTYVATVNLWRSQSVHRSVVWSRSWTSSGTHVVTIRVVGTRGHPRVDVDALLVLT